MQGAGSLDEHGRAPAQVIGHMIYPVVAMDVMEGLMGHIPCHFGPGPDAHPPTAPRPAGSCGIPVSNGGSVTRASRAGFSLIEVLMVVILIGIMAGIGFPMMRDALIKSDVKSARAQAMLLYAQGRASAQESGRRMGV